MPVPFLGRLNIIEYAALVSSFLLVGLEAIVRVLTLALPSTLISLFYRASRRLFNGLSTPAQKRAEERRRPISTSIRDASDFVEMCALAGYMAEEHVVQTKDGYLLCVHRLAWRKGEEDQRVNSGPGTIQKRVAYLHHGLLMNSEVWVCLTDADRCLPFVLVEHGFDVWLGNNRGNKYSKKSIRCTSTSLDFWNFSIDEFAFHDIPDSIAYILETTGQRSLSYIGFSQGTAQAFASLAVHPRLNNQINVFIALAPAMSPAGLSNGIVDALVKASPSVLYLLFGRRSILSSATMWESILYPPIFIRVIDMGLTFLFNWRTKNISTSQKLAAYPHLYSYTSTKSVVHWFQIIRTKSFQMYDDDVHPPLSLSSASKYTKVARYPTRNIKTPIVLIHGGSDSLVDIRVMLRELPPQTVATEIPHYEHLDFLWARDVDAQVFRHVFDALDSFTGAEHTKEEYSRYRSARSTSINASRSFRRHVAHPSHDSNTGEFEGLSGLGGNVGVGYITTDVDGDGESDSADPPSDAGTQVNGRGPSRRRQHQATEGLWSPDRAGSTGRRSPRGVMLLAPAPLATQPDRSQANSVTSPHDNETANDDRADTSTSTLPPRHAQQSQTQPQPQSVGLQNRTEQPPSSPSRLPWAVGATPPRWRPTTQQQYPQSTSPSPTRPTLATGALSRATRTMSSTPPGPSPTAWSSGAGTVPNRPTRSASSMSIESMREGRGIRLGAGRVVGGVVTAAVAGGGGGTGSGSGSGPE